jgi:hypothetical protein
MPTRTLPTLLGALALSIVFGGTNVYAQGVTQPVKPTMPHKPSAQSAQKKAPGKACGDLMSNSQAHKDCIAKQAKSDQATKKAKQKKS